MILEFFKKILNTEYLPMNEVRKLKIYLILLFLAIFTGLTIPISQLLNYTFWVKFIFIGFFFLLIIFTILFLKFSKLFLAMQSTIIHALLIMIFYTQGISSFYAYLLFYITLTIIALYQEVYSYFVYGTTVLVLGILYLVTHKSGLLIPEDIAGAIYIYVTGLALYYLINFAHILVNEKSYADMNLEWIKSKKTNDSIQEDIYTYVNSLRRIEKEPPIYEDLEFQKAVFEISEFIAKQIMKDGEEIINVADLYVYIHEKGIDTIIDNEEISINMKKTTDSLKKYLLNDNSDLFSMVINFYLRNKKSKFDLGHDLTTNSLTQYSDEQLIAFCLIYSYLALNLYSSSEWNKFDNKTFLQNISSIDFEEFFDDDIIAFYNDNEKIIKKHLTK
ncbi:MAG: hypothetical protein K9L64_05520 [Candidatus Izimaplasma sp.]|nr:hypothetical protein [Candidatus Izimaplasma bacterium]